MTIKRKILALGAALFLVAMSQGFADAKGRYTVLELSGSVNPIMAEYIAESIEKANAEKMKFVVIQMDTPGGFLNATRDIVKSILGSEIPVVVYTYPKGAQAASAGGFIMLSAHVAAMAPGTEIGAMSPVSMMPTMGQDNSQGDPSESVMGRKVMNDTAAYAKSLAEKRNRNVDWALRAVKDATSSTYTEALRAGVIDFIAEDMDELVEKLDGRKVSINGDTVTLNTASLTEVTLEMDWKQKFLNYFADPQLVMLLFLIAVVGIGMEFKNPGMIVPGAIGGVSLFLFLMAVRVLPINVVGLILIVLAVGLFVAELYIVSYGLLTIGGIASFVIGAMILFDSPLPGGQIPLPTIITTVILLLLFVFFVVKAVINVHKTRITTGIEGLVGDTGTVMKDFSGKGKIWIKGEIWNAFSSDELKKDDRVIVTEVRGMELVVEKMNEQRLIP